jgi:hypothetical protein
MAIDFAFFACTDYFQTSTTFQLPVLNWMTFRERFSVAGRCPKDLDPVDEVVFYCITAQGSLVSRHHAILGPGPPKTLPGSPDASGTVDLSPDGCRRETIFQSLKKQAVDLCDTRALWRTPSPGGVACVILISYLVGQAARDVRDTRLYTATSFTLLKELLNEMDAPEQ